MPRGNYKKTFDMINSSTQRKIHKLETDMINKALNELSTCNVSNVPSNISTFEIIENDSHTSTFNRDEIDAADLLNEISDSSNQTNPTLNSEEENNEVLPLFEQQEFSSNDEIEDNNKDNEKIDFKTFLANWAVEENISQASLRTLIKGIKQYTCNKCHCNIPSDPRALLHTPRSVNIRNCADGEYCHFSLLKSIKNFVSAQKMLLI